MNQTELRKLAEERVKDAEALLAAGRWEFAYYAAGYAVECALKSCILARMVHTAWVFEEKWKAQECMTHDMIELIRLAGLKGELDDALAASSEFVSNWATVEKWKVVSRYESKTEAEAKALLAAINDAMHGVLIWIKAYW